jgi:hypothetical protein
MKQEEHTCTCANCLNAYNTEGDPNVYCWNKDFMAQYDSSIDTTTWSGGYCDGWTQRRSDQKPLRFNQPTQLRLDFE